MLAESTSQETDKTGIEPFSLALSKNGIQLIRKQTATLQINVGFLCNQACRHCHLDAGPARRENMASETVDAVVAYAERGKFGIVDITGGAPDLNPHIETLIEKIAPLAPRLMFRSNLSALNDGKRDHLADLLKFHSVVIVASFPSLNASQTDTQRGKGVFEISVGTLKKLNAMGYGQEGTGLELSLVSNPAGAFLPSAQASAEKRFREVLRKKYDIVFNELFNFANVPLGRFRQWLVKSGNFEKYMERLASSFKPCAVDGLMCRTLVSVAWDGHLYDCDFNLARGLFMGGQKTHVSEMPGKPEPDSPIAVADHCYSCTAGEGFT